MRWMWVIVVAMTVGRGWAQDVARGGVDFGKGVGRVEGFGFSEAFGEAGNLRALPEEKRKEVLELLFGRETGAGFNMLRLGIETDSRLEKTAPGGETPWAAKAVYSFDGDDGGQVWLAQQAKRYGVTNFTADAWSAPVFMKTSQAVVGGMLCGLAGAGCGPQVWAKAYSEYLLEYVRAYRRLGIVIASLGFANEPDINVSYASMLMSPAQAVELLGVFGPALRRAGLGLKVTCCDASTWGGGGGVYGGDRREPGARVCGRDDGA